MEQMMGGMGASEVGAGAPMPGPVADPGAAAGGGKRELMQLMASLGRSGPNLQASVQRRLPIG
jgi:hypothetical protein